MKLRIKAIGFFSGMIFAIYFGVHICAVLAGAAISPTDRVIYSVIVAVWAIGFVLSELHSFLGAVICILEEREKREASLVHPK